MQMSVAIIDEWPLGDSAESILHSAARYADHVRLSCPWVQLSLWLRPLGDLGRLIQVRIFDRHSDYLNDGTSGLMDAGREGTAGVHRAPHGKARECEVFRSTGGGISEIGPDQTTENIAAMTEWTFRREADQAQALAAIDDYFRHLKRRRHSLLFSIFLRQRSEPTHFAQLSVFKRPAALEKEREAEPCNEFLRRLHGGLAEEQTRFMMAQVVVSSRATLSKVGPGRGRRRSRPMTWAPAIGA
jgi:hypothetical protein